MHFLVDVEAGDPASAAAPRPCTHCMIVFVALDDVEGAPVEVPSWQPASEEDRRLAGYAREAMALGKGIEAVVARGRSGD